jgi:hypothetical protein
VDPTTAAAYGSRVVVAFVTDLFFSARIRETARAAGVACEIARIPADAVQKGAAARLVIVDMEVPGAPGVVQAIKQGQGQAVVVGYLHDANDAAIEAARTSGCDKVLSRGGLTKKLPELIVGK